MFLSGAIIVSPLCIVAVFFIVSSLWEREAQGRDGKEDSKWGEIIVVC